MKILYTNFHTAPGIGGHTAYIACLASHLSARHTVAVAAPESSALLRLARGIDGVQTHAQRYPNRPLPLFGAVRAMRRILKQGRFDIVHVNGSADHRLVILASLFMRKSPKIVLTKHNDMPIRGFSSRLRTWLGTHHVIAVCEHVQRQVDSSPYGDVGVSRIFNGIDTARFVPFRDAEVAGLRDRFFKDKAAGKIVRGSNAGTSSYKGWIDMVRAVASLPSRIADRFHVTVAGGKPSAEDLAEIDTLGMRHRFTYAGDLDDVRGFVGAIDVGFVLSHRVETISFACREMMATGKPVIVTSHAGLPENVTDGVDGWVVPPRSPQGIAEVLTSILEETHDLDAMRRAARDKAVRDFSIEPFVRGTEQVYRGVLEDAPA
jgi:glycosyltransferase involved in cell wall biosynthesis